MVKDQTDDQGSNFRLEFNVPKNFTIYGNYDIVLATYLTDKDMDIVEVSKIPIVSSFYLGRRRKVNAGCLLRSLK